MPRKASTRWVRVRSMVACYFFRRTGRSQNGIGGPPSPALLLPSPWLPVGWPLAGRPPPRARSGGAGLRAGPWAGLALRAGPGPAVGRAPPLRGAGPGLAAGLAPPLLDAGPRRDGPAPNHGGAGACAGLAAAPPGGRDAGAADCRAGGAADDRGGGATAGRGV